MNVPDPKANTTTEAYLAYKAGYLEESELKPVLYEPYLHFDAWLAYWAGLTSTYPVTVSKKNLFGFSTIVATSCTYTEEDGVYTITATANSPSFRVELKQNIPAGSYTWSGGISGWTISPRKTDGTSLGVNNNVSPYSFTTTDDMGYVTFFSGIQSGQTAILDLSDFMIEAGSTPSEYEPYATPEMLCDEEALVAYLSGVTDTYPEDIKDPYDVRIVGYLKYLVSARFGRPDYPVNNEEFYLSTMDAPHTSNETPSADIELDTSEGKLIDVKAYGDTFQQTYSGKNIYDELQLALNGNWTRLSDGSIERTITTTGNMPIYSDSNVTNPIGTYTISFDLRIATPGVTVTMNNTAYIWGVTSNQLNDGEGNPTTRDTRTLSSNWQRYSFTVTTTEALTWNSGRALHLYTYVVSAEANIQLRHLQIEQGSTPTAYEPYVGSSPSQITPAPNPDYPQDIQVVTGEQTVNVHSKNLFNSYIATKPYWQAGTLVVNPDGTFTVSGNTGSNNYFQLGQTLGTLCPNLKVGDQVYLYLDTTGTSKRIYINAIWVNGEMKTITQAMLNTNVVIYGGYNQTDTIKIMVTKALETTYESYQSQNYTISLGNMFDASTIEAGDIKNGNQNIRLCSRQSLWLEAGTYTFSTNLIAPFDYTISTNSVGAPPLTVYPTYSYSSDWAQSPTTTFTINQGGWFAVQFRKHDNSNLTPADVLQFNYQLNRGTTVTTPIELCKIGNYQDYIYKSGDDWYVHKELGKITLDGTETWTWNQYTVSQPRFATTLDYTIPAQLAVNVKCTHFTPINNTDSIVLFQNSIRVQANRIDFDFTVATQPADLTGVLSWLSSNQPKVYYVLATATDTKITDSTLIAQLNALAGADTYNEKTYIKVTANDPNLPALLKVEAYKY